MKAAFTRLVAAASIIMAAMPVAAEAQIFIGTKPLSNPIEFETAEPKILVGPTIGLNRNYHSGGFRTIDEAICPFFQSGNGVGFSGGITAEYGHKYWSIIPRITYQSRPGSFEQQMDNVPIFIPDEGVTVNQSVTAKSEVDYRLLNAEVMFKHDVVVINNKVFIGLAAGPSVGYVLDGRISQYQDLVEPLNARFVDPQRPGIWLDSDGRRMYYADNKDIPGRKSLHFSLKAGLQAEVGLFANQVMMTPGIYYDFGLNNVTGNENWSLNSVMFQVDFRRAL